MRTGHQGGWLEDGGKLIGISLGADYCAEHEFGINALKWMLGIDGANKQVRLSREPEPFSMPPGLPRRMITKHDCVRLYEKKGAAVLLCEPAWQLDRLEEDIQKLGMAKALKDGLPMNLPKPKAGLGCAWSDDDFGIYGAGKEQVKKIRDLYKAFQENNVAIWVGGGGVFKNGGLVLVIADRVPAEGAETLRNADIERETLTKASDATGILERLKSAGKGYYACSPRWNRDGFEKKSALPVIYFLNPAEQNENNFGWYTVEELDQWILGTGPIPKTKKAVV